MTEFDFETAKEEWSRLPVDNIGYWKASDVLNFSKSQIGRLISVFEENRYSLKGWRNHENLWRSTLGLDSTEDKTILDFGSGFGIESLQFLYNGNEVILADLCETNLKAAEYILNCCGYRAKELVLVDYDDPYFSPSNQYDIFYSNGVLHHTPKIKEILERAASFFKGEPEFRLMLYSDVAWINRTSQPLIYDTPVHTQEGFEDFVIAMDAVGKYADWYDEKKLKAVLPKDMGIVDFTYICSSKEYLTAKIKSKNV